jgi:integrase/recombinase XerD
MSMLTEHAQRYLRARRALGVKLERHGRLLPQLIGYLEAAGASTVTSELAISWARLPGRAHPQHWAARLSIARGFAAYLQTIDPSTEIPPAGVFAVRYQRPTPYLWSGEDIGRLLEAARELRPPLKAASYQTLFGLLAVTGMRLGEAIALEPDDIDLENGVITIRTQAVKLERARMVPLHPTTLQALEHYARTKARLCPRPRSSTFFLSSIGTRLYRSAVAKTLRELTSRLGLRTDTVHPSVNHRLPSAPAAIPPTGKLFAVGIVNSVIVPVGVIRPILSPLFSVNHTLASAPAAIPTGELPAVGIVNSVNAPSGAGAAAALPHASSANAPHARNATTRLLARKRSPNPP